jgi:hypothetical protein
MNNAIREHPAVSCCTPDAKQDVMVGPTSLDSRRLIVLGQTSSDVRSSYLTRPKFLYALRHALISSHAFALAKFCSISRVGGKPRLVHLSMYCTSSCSCCGLRWRCASPEAVFVACFRWCRRDSVVRPTLHLIATLRHENSSPNSRDSISSIAS